MSTSPPINIDTLYTNKIYGHARYGSVVRSLRGNLLVICDHDEKMLIEYDIETNCKVSIPWDFEKEPKMNTIYVSSLTHLTWLLVFNDFVEIVTYHDGFQKIAERKKYANVDNPSRDFITNINAAGDWTQFALVDVINNIVGLADIGFTINGGDISILNIETNEIRKYNFGGFHMSFYWQNNNEFMISFYGGKTSIVNIENETPVISPTNFPDSMLSFSKDGYFALCLVPRGGEYRKNTTYDKLIMRKQQRDMQGNLLYAVLYRKQYFTCLYFGERDPTQMHGLGFGWFGVCIEDSGVDRGYLYKCDILTESMFTTSLICYALEKKCGNKGLKQRALQYLKF